MPHVLFHGSPRVLAVLGNHLDSLGMTFEVVPAQADGGRQATVRDCDVVIRCLDGGGSEDRRLTVSPEDGSPAPATGPPPAPVLAVTRGPAPPDAWRVVASVEADQVALEAALQSCCERAAVLRGAAVRDRRETPPGDRLSHELRTPLTAIKTALEALEPHVELEDGARRMVAIALRNVARLEESVAWGESLLVSAGVDDLGREISTA